MYGKSGKPAPLPRELKAKRSGQRRSSRKPQCPANPEPAAQGLTPSGTFHKKKKKKRMGPNR